MDERRAYEEQTDKRVSFETFQTPIGFFSVHLRRTFLNHISRPSAPAPVLGSRSGPSNPGPRLRAPL